MNSHVDNLIQRNKTNTKANRAGKQIIYNDAREVDEGVEQSNWIELPT